MPWKRLGKRSIWQKTPKEKNKGDLPERQKEKVQLTERTQKLGKRRFSTHEGRGEKKERGRPYGQDVKLLSSKRGWANNETQNETKKVLDGEKKMKEKRPGGHPTRKGCPRAERKERKVRPGPATGKG